MLKGRVGVWVERSEQTQPPKAEPQERREMRRRAPAAGWPRRDSSARDTHRPPSGCRACTSWPARLLCQPSPGRPIPGAPGRGPAPAGRAGPRGRAWSRRKAPGVPWLGWAESAFCPRRHAWDPELGGAPPPPPPASAPAAAAPGLYMQARAGGGGGGGWLLRRGPERSDVSLWREPGRWTAVSENHPSSRPGVKKPGVPRAPLSFPGRAARHPTLDSFPPSTPSLEHYVVNPSFRCSARAPPG